MYIFLGVASTMLLNSEDSSSTAPLTVLNENGDLEFNELHVKGNVNLKATGSNLKFKVRIPSF